MRRIPGGWVATEAYISRIEGGYIQSIDQKLSSVFIPFSTEFHPDVVKTRELAATQKEKMSIEIRDQREFVK